MAWFLVHGYPIGSYGGMPDQGLPGYGRPDQGLPGWGGGPVDPGYGGGWAPGPHPGNRPPGSWGGPVDPGWGGGPPLHPGNRPPGSRPPLPGQGLPPEWNLPDNSLPGSQPGIDNTLPGGPDYGTGQPIVPGATPYGSAVATAPPEKVDAEHGAWVLVNVHGALVWAWAQKPKAVEKPPEAGAAPKK